jgi:hydroxymethylpyrimidine/phosphomethylpyrimidine kinase
MLSETDTLSQTFKRVLSIAGSDSGGGAGIQADLKTFAALGVYGMTALTALTAQNTQGVQAIHAIPSAFLKSQIESVCDDIGVDAVKIGMLHTPEMVEVVAWAMDRYQWSNVILDPVMVATSGDRLINEETVEGIVRELFPRVSLITPNLDEVQVLLGYMPMAQEDLMRAAKDLQGMGAKAVLVKGGHLPGEMVVDVYLGADQHIQVFKSPRIHSLNVHGTGCTLSSAIAAGLAKGQSMELSLTHARAFIAQAIEGAREVKTGGRSGPYAHGPLNHGFGPVVMVKAPL